MPIRPLSHPSVELRADRTGARFDSYLPPVPFALHAVRTCLVTPLQPGDPRRLGRWRLERRLGAGGMGVVYLARSRRTARVAIKVPRADLARDPEFRERFRREAGAASSVVARCTARVLEVHSEGARPYIVTEYVEGPTLHAAVTADGPLTGPDLVAFATGVAEAMAAMHAAGVTHRDLTPGNVILGRWGPKVIDFGIAHADDASTLTQTGVRIGTPAWMAPEQARGERVGPAADTFSWGTLVAYAGTGRHPFGNGRADAVLYRVVHESPDLAGLELALAPLVERALDKNPAARPVPADLLDVLTPIEAGFDAAGASAATLPAPVTRVMTAPPAPPRPPVTSRRVPSTPPPPIAPRRRRRWVRALGLALLVVFVGVGLGAGIALLLDRNDPDDGVAAAPPDTRPAPTTTDPPTTTTVPSLDVYCLSAQDYYDGFDAFEDELSFFPTDEEYEEGFIEFANDNLDLFAELRDTAPPEIADDIAVMTDGFEQAAAGDFSAVETDEFLDAEDRVITFDEQECGVDRGLF